MIKSILNIIKTLLRNGRQNINEVARERVRNTIEGEVDAPTMEVSLYQTDALSDKRGRMPEKTVALYIAQAIEDAGFNYRVHYGYEETYTPPGETKESFDWWVENSPERAATSNILLVDNRGGGRAGWSGINCVIGMNRVNSAHQKARNPCSSQSCDNAWGAVHEFGHNLGGKHATPMMTPKPEMLFSDEMKDLLDKRLENGELNLADD